MKVSLPLPRKRHVVAATAGHDVIAVAADQHVVALAAGDGVVAGTAVNGEAYDTGRKAGGIDDVVAAEGLDGELVVDAFCAGKRDRRRQAGYTDRTSRSIHLNIVVAGGTIDGHAIGLAVAHIAARCPREVDRDLGDAGTGEVADRDVVGTAEGGELDVLDAVEIHGDVADVAGERSPARDWP